MKQFSKIQLELLHQLSDGQCHSGKLLGEQLGVSRTAIWKQISQLTEWGLAVKRIPQRGYQLAQTMIPLDESLIRQYLQEQQFNRQLNINLFATIDSTNRFLKDLTPACHPEQSRRSPENQEILRRSVPLDDAPPPTPSIAICCAETQTQGRGRFGRQWISPFGENIYFSSRWELNCCLSRLSGLSLVVGLAILASLRMIEVEEGIRIKWPNDILWGNKKLCGILIEVIAETNSCAQVIIGIGVNVNTATQAQPLGEKPWCSLYEITGKYFERNGLLANLIIQLIHHLQQFLTSGFTAFTSDWQKVDYLQHQFITVSQPTGVISGVACGVNELGQLCLQDERGKLHYLSSGDTSLKMEANGVKFVPS